SVGASDYLTANYKKLMRIAEALRYFSAPYISAAGWNAEPRLLEDLGFMQALPAIAVAPPTGTCRAATTGNLSTIDYWLTSPDFAKDVLILRLGLGSIYSFTFVLRRLSHGSRRASLAPARCQAHRHRSRTSRPFKEMHAVDYQKALKQLNSAWAHCTPPSPPSWSRASATSTSCRTPSATVAGPRDPRMFGGQLADHHFDKDIHSQEGAFLFEAAWRLIHYAVMQDFNVCLTLPAAYATAVESHAEKLEPQAARKRTGQFREWAQDAMITGAAPLFGMTKLRGWAHNEVDRFGIRAALPKAVANSQMDFWNDIWKGDVVSPKPDEDKVMTDFGDIT
ncbi:unnamed protein product, partial [Prorocentrum cordatum]